MALRSDSTVSDIAPTTFDTDTLDIFEFIPRAYARFPQVFGQHLAITLFISSIGWVSWFLVFQGHAGFVLGLPVVLFLVNTLPGRTTRAVVVKRLDDTGRPFLDEQRLWLDEYRKFPDAPQFNAGGTKQLWLDTTGDKPVFFQPWAAPDPENPPVGSVQIIGQEALNASAMSIAMHRSKVGVLAKYGAQLMVLGIAFVALFLAANRTATLFGVAE